MRIVEHFMKVFLICAGVLLLMVVSDMLRPRKAIQVKVDPSFVVYPDSVDDEWNREARVETAFNLGIHVDSVTQEQFNERY